MKSMSDEEVAQTETLLRKRLAQLADHAPTTVHLPGVVAVVPGQRRAGRARRAGMIAAITGLIGAGGFTTYSFLGASNGGGAATPEEAVTTFVSAIEHEDVLGMIDVTLPEEVGALRAAVDSVQADAKRVGVLADQLDVSGVQGVDVRVDDLVLDTNFLEGDLALVTATTGTFSASFDPQAFPFGDKMRRLVGDSGAVDTLKWALDGSGTAAQVMTVQRDGRWYVSLEYTLAEYIRQSAGWALPGPVSRTPVGFDSAEKAVTGFYDRLGALDLQGAMDTFAPGEDAMAWIAQSWMADAQAALDRGRKEGWSLGISGLTYATIGTGERLTLKPLAFKIDGTVPQHYTATADPTLPTVVAAYDGSGYALLPPGEMPPTTDGLTFTDNFAFPADSNFTMANSNGTIQPLVFASEQTAGAQPFSFERADGCTTFSGTGGANSLLGVFSVSPLATKVDGGYRICGDDVAAGGIGLLVLSGGGPFNLPSVSVVQSGGKWYVSPLGTLLASVSTGMHDATAESSLFDSAIAPFLYGGFSRTMLEALAIDQPADSVGPACLPALIVENGTITGVIADPPLDAVRACAELGFRSSSSSGAAVVTAQPPPVTESSVP
ncbi:MAG: hypothetical protein ABI894_00255 [Ilumatobacteraceae bacterium]